MNAMRSATCSYQAVTNDGNVHYLGYASAFSWDDVEYQDSEFGGKQAHYELWECYEENGEEIPPRPQNLVRLLHPYMITEAWSGKKNCYAEDLARMFSLCGIPEETVVGMILTYGEEGKWEFGPGAERFVISRTPQPA